MMKRLLLVLALLLSVSCQNEIELFDEVNTMAGFDKKYNPTLIQSGRGSGFPEPLMEYSLFRIDSLEFQDLENSIFTNTRFKEGTYYLNIELNDYILSSGLDILNMSNSSITANQYQNTYYIYLMSDRKTFAVCKVNH